MYASPIPCSTQESLGPELLQGIVHSVFAGIYTGSVYYDPDLALHGFPAEKVTNGSVVVVKTHLKPSREFNKAVLLVRDMSDAVVADINRRMSGGHTGEVPDPMYKKHRE